MVAASIEDTMIEKLENLGKETFDARGIKVKYIIMTVLSSEKLMML